MTEKTANQMTKRLSGKDLFNKYGILMVFLILFILLTVITNTFFTSRNLINVLKQVSINGIISVGMMCVLLTGGIDLSVGSIVALSGIVATTFAHPGEYPVIVPIILGVLAGAACGVVNGTLVAFLNLPAFIATLGMLSVASGVALVLSKGRPISNLSDQFRYIGGGTILGLPILIYILAAVFLIGYLILSWTKFGRYLYAIGGNEEAAKASGLSVARIKLFVYMISGICAGLAGTVLASRINAGQPNSGEGYELDAIAAVVIGGTSLNGGIGKVSGTILGVLIVGVINNGMDLLNISSYYQKIVKGSIIVLAVLLDRITKNKNK
ncbi:ABC transporter permease [uncultured Robinsoniella sp.]|uniref:ABC transporter permease n=1 Tax=uncultured Robinsoniella sp. TaxID=904190 RepID=UPI00374ED80E